MFGFTKNDERQTCNNVWLKKKKRLKFILQLVIRILRSKQARQKFAEDSRLHFRDTTVFC